MCKAIIVEHVSKYYGGVEALHDVGFSVDKGEIFGLVGPDGSGKTSMFRILATLVLPDGTAALMQKKASGADVTGENAGCNGFTVTVDGFDAVDDMAEIRKRIGYMPGKFSLYQDLSVEENLEFFATLFGTTVEAEYGNIKAIYSQIEPFKKRRAGALSGGMKQKLALSCALVHKPSLLLLDEPTTGVDPVSRKEFWGMLETLAKQGMTIVVSTPYIDEVRRCNRIAFMQKGRIMGIGKPSEILETFRDVFCPDRMEGHESKYGSTASENGVPHVERGKSIEVSHLVKAFGSFRAVNDISFSVDRGEIFGFLGANGAGKTTAMHMLTGLTRPTGGSGQVAGCDIVAEHEQIKKHIGYMSQKFSLYNDLTVRENIRLFAGIYGMDDAEIKRKTEALLHRLQFAEHGNDIVADLPLGWKQKLAFSVSIFHEPEIVFLDEPTGGVDPATRRQFWQLIYDAAGRGITVFVTTHYMDEAEYCDRISIMVDGKIKAMGTPDRLKREWHQPDIDGVFTCLARQATRK